MPAKQVKLTQEINNNNSDMNELIYKYIVIR